MHSDAASGSFAKVLVASIWKGNAYMRLRVVPKNPQTQNQADARQKLGVVGYFESFVLRPTKLAPTDKSQFWIDGVAAAPAGQSWISFATRSILGTGNSAFDFNHAAYAALGGTPQGVYTTAAALAGFADFNLSYGTQTAISTGEQLYHLLNFAISRLGYVLSAGTLAAPDAGGLSDFVDYFTATV